MSSASVPRDPMVVVSQPIGWKWWHHALLILAVCWGGTWMIDAAQPRHPIKEAIGGVITNVSRLAMLVLPFMALKDPPNIQHYAIGPDGTADGHQNHEFVEKTAESAPPVAAE